MQWFCNCLQDMKKNQFSVIFSMIVYIQPRKLIFNKNENDKIVVERICALWWCNKAIGRNDLRFSFFCFTLIAFSIRSMHFFHLASGVDKDFVVAELLSEWRTLCLHIAHVNKYPTVIVNLLSITTLCIISVTIVTW